MTYTNLIFSCIIPKFPASILKHTGLLVSFLMFVNLSETQAQSVLIDFGNTRIALNEPLRVSVESIGKRIESLGSFPEIEGFRKIAGQLSSASSTSNINGKITRTYIRTQTYYPQKEGSFDVSSFDIEVNGEVIKAPPTQIVVGSRDEDLGGLPPVGLGSLFNEGEEGAFREVQEDAFLGLSVSNKSVYVGEEFHVILALYVSILNPAPMKFHDMGRQVEEISQKLKPINCWEENFEISKFSEPSRLVIRGKEYDQYIFYQASFFPLNAEPVVFPKVGLKMIVKNKIGEEENLNDFEDPNSNNFKTFYTLARQIEILALPEHPLKNKVSVGQYYLQEEFYRKKAQTGESFNYRFTIRGQGNLSAIRPPEIAEQDLLEFYPPNSRLFVKREANRVSGTVVYSYPIIPKEAGSYPLGEYFQWIYFDPVVAQYDTLKPRALVNVSGNSMRNSEIRTMHHVDIYQKINHEPTDTKQVLVYQNYHLIAEILVFLFLITSIFALYWHRSRP